MLKQNNPLGFDFSIPLITDCFHRLLCTSCLGSFKHRKSVFCLDLLPVDLWDSCCQLYWKPFLVPRDGMRRQTAAGWEQHLPAADLCQQLPPPPGPPSPGCPLTSGEMIRDVFPMGVHGKSYGGPHPQAAAATAVSTCDGAT